MPDPIVPETEFKAAAVTTSLTARDLAMFAGFRIPSELLAAAGIERVSDRDARERFGLTGPRSRDLSGIVFPYASHITGERVTARVRRDHPEVEDGQPKNKYISAYGDRRHLYFPPATTDKLQNKDTHIVLVEAEKSVLALTAWAERTGKSVLAVGLGGCWGWRGRIGKTEAPDGARVDVEGPIPDLDVCDGRTVFVLFDANAAINLSVQRARKSLVRELCKRRCLVRVCWVPSVPGVNGPDDLIAQRGDDAIIQVFDKAGGVPASGTVADTDDGPEPEPLNGELPPGGDIQNVTVTDTECRWPELADAALHGLAGDVVRTIDPHTEADRAAILMQFLAAFGNIIGPGPHCAVEATRHALNLFCVLVGETSKARKGTSWNHIRRLFERVDPVWARDRVTNGLSSAEGLIGEVRDVMPLLQAVEGPPPDRRLLVVQDEFASVLKIMEREGNTLSPTLRSAWDSGNLRTLVKHNPLRATGAHISLIGHITRPELLRYLSETESHNGFANRLLWVCVKRSKCLPEGGRVAECDVARLAAGLKDAVTWAREQPKVLRRDSEARALWVAVYPRLSEGRGGLLGAATSRAEAQVLRLSAIYAALDRSAVVRVEHLQAALGVWDYCFQAASFIFGDALGDPVADRIREALKIAGGAGLNRTQISALFGRHVSSSRIGQALSQLAKLGLAEPRSVVSEGRSVEVWTAK